MNKKIDIDLIKPGEYQKGFSVGKDAAISYILEIVEKEKEFTFVIMREPESGDDTFINKDNIITKLKAMKEDK